MIVPSHLTPAYIVKRLKESSFTHDVIYTMGTRGIVAILGILSSRILGPHGRGDYATALVFAGLCMQFGNLGLHSSNIYFTANKKYPLGSILSLNLITALGLGSLIALSLKTVFHFHPQWAPVYDHVLNLALLWIPIGLGYLFFQNILIGLKKIRVYNTIELTVRVLVLAAMVALIFWGHTTPASFVSAGLLGLLIGFVWMLMSLKPVFSLSRPSAAYIKDNLHFGAKIYLATLFSFLVFKVDLLLVKHYLGPQAAGLYSIDSAIVDFLLIFPATVNTLLMAKLSGISDPAERWRLTKKSLAVVIVTIITLLMTAGVLARPLILFVFGEAYRGSIAPFYYLIPGLFFVSLVTLINAFFAASGMPSYAIVPPFLSALINIGLNLWLIPRRGIIGAAIAASLTFFIYFVLTVLFLRTKSLPPTPEPASP